MRHAHPRIEHAPPKAKRSVIDGLNRSARTLRSGRRVSRADVIASSWVSVAASIPRATVVRISEHVKVSAITSPQVRSGETTCLCAHERCRCVAQQGWRANASYSSGEISSQHATPTVEDFVASGASRRATPFDTTQPAASQHHDQHRICNKP